MESKQSSGGVRGRRPWLIWTVGIIAAVLLLAAFMSRGEVVPVQAAVIQRSTIRSVISTNGKVEPLQNFQAHAPIGTTVKRLLVTEGDHVKRGQLLLQLDDAEAQSQAAQALAQMRSADATISGIQAGGTREEVLSLESQLAKAKTVRDTAQRNLDAMQRLQQQGAASSGEVTAAQDQLTRANADLELLQQKQKERYSPPEIAQAEAQKTEAHSSAFGWCGLFPSRPSGRLCKSR
jgi:HlyD family secretion protein